MKIMRRIFHPFITFIAIQLLWVVLLIGWITWFLGRHQQLRELAARFQTELLPQNTDWLILAEGIVLLVAILIGVYVIFIYWRRQAALYRAQHNFIAQVSHELKSPLASLQLHLETIEMRQPEPEQLRRFVKLMQDDTARLGSLIANLLTASKLEHRDRGFNLESANFSAALERWLQRKQKLFPPQGTLSWSIEPDLWVCFDVEAIETVLRNLLENAMLYTEGAPQVRVELRRQANHVLVTFTDQGRGIELCQQKKVFRMFYRVRTGGKTIRGSGLGLFIVRSILRRHQGRVWLHSDGIGKGTCFYLEFPLCPASQRETP
ncbi:MAG: HAMP domain-containing histidine kinase [Deltaproteobacteria bacterium]|nr:HAMP domain-containing histidine kinase [Deltaproteobacteria bacterium]NCP03994.1 HAMP domain-containing histidine kinase [Deltaproteobacteria bacterium]